MEIEKKTEPQDALTVRSDSETPLSGRRAEGPSRTLSRALSSAAAPADGLLVVLWRSRWIMLICLLAAIDGGIAYLQFVTPIYTGTAKLYLDYSGVRLSNPYDPGSRPQTDKYLCTQAEIIKSRPILTAVENALASRRLRTLADVDVPTAYLQRNLVVEIGKKDEVISIALRCPYPAEAAEIVNCVMTAYRDSRAEREQHSLSQLLNVLQADLVRTRKELDEKQNELTDFQRDHMPLALGPEQGNSVTQGYSACQNALTAAKLLRIDAESFLKDVQALARDPTGLRQYVQLHGNAGAYAGGDPEKAPLDARIIDLKHQKETLLKKVTPTWPDVTALQAEIEQLEAQLKELDNRFVKAVLAAADQQVVGAKKKEAEVVQLCSQEKEQVEMLGGKLAQYQRLRTEVDHLTLSSQNLDQQVRDIGKLVGEETGQLRMAVLEEALPAAVPSAPQAARVMGMALILGLLLGGGMAVARDWLNQSLRSADEISALLHVPVLGAVPAMPRRRRLQDRGRKVLLQPDSREAEAFRTIRTAVLFGASPEGAKTMLITSPAAGEGKSTLVSNLAIALANAGQKTLVLDADFRKPVQHIIFGLDPHERCLSQVFTGTMTLATAVQPSGIEGLHVLTGGFGISHPAEVLNSQQFAHLLTCLTEVYDRIVIDAPPVTVVTDAQILGALCDATVLVLRADKSARRVALHAIDALQSVGARLLGVVVNEVHRSGHRYGYYYDRYHRYYGARAKRGRAGAAQSNIPVAPLHIGTMDSDARALPVRRSAEGA